MSLPGRDGRTDGRCGAAGDGDDRTAAFGALLEDDVEDLYENAPCGYLSTLMDGEIAKINATLLGWLGLRREDVVGRMRFADLLTVGGKLYHETHFAPLLRMQGEIAGIALEMKGTDGRRLPVLVTAVLKKSAGGEPVLIRATVYDARARRSYERELLRARKEAEAAGRRAEQRRAETERERARLREVVATLQQSLLPPSLPDVPGLQAAAHYRTASPDLLGGDFYDLLPLGGDRWAFFLGDVCGKGAGAAALTSVARYTLRTAALHEAQPAAMLATLNTALTDRYGAGDARYCTVIVGVLTRGEAGFDIRLAGGGHPPALLLRAEGTAEYVRTPGGMLVGVLPAARFTTAHATLRPGDTLLLYTDGLTEARTGGPGRERFGDEALLALAGRLAPTAAQALVTRLAGVLEDFATGLDDDTALLALGCAAR
jgi:phosphoserine phosphatase RsbU/P